MLVRGVGAHVGAIKLERQGDFVCKGGDPLWKFSLVGCPLGDAPRRGTDCVQILVLPPAPLQQKMAMKTEKKFTLVCNSARRKKEGAPEKT